MPSNPFDLSGRNSTTIRGLHIFAATINTDSGSSNTNIDSIDAKYLSQFERFAYLNERNRQLRKLWAGILQSVAGSRLVLK